MPPAASAPDRSRTVADWFTSEDLHRDPYAVWSRLRKESPVCWSPLVGAWLITRRADMEKLYGRKDLISVEAPGNPVNEALGTPNILSSDGPVHAELRGSINQVMLPRTVDSYVDSLVAPIVAHRLGQLPDSGTVDLNRDYFEPVSVLSLGTLIGLGHVPLEKLQYWFHSLSAGAFDFEKDPGKAEVCAQARADVTDHLHRELERLEREPDGSLMSEMLHRGMPPGRTRERELIIPTLLIIIVGGSQEPGHSSGMLFHGLFEHPEQLRDLQADVETLLPRAINEGLRWQPPLGTLERVAVRSFEHRGQEIAKDDMLIFLPGSVNRDEEFYARPDDFDIHRSEVTHRAFGMGDHMCMGHWFARRQMQMGISALLRSYPDLGPVDGDTGELTGWAARGPSRLPADLGQREAGRRVDPVVRTVVRRPATVTVRVEAVERVADEVVAVTFGPVSGEDLPAWSPGAHVDLHVGDGLVRQYSLCGDPGDRTRYRVAVRRDDRGRGGSVRLHEAARPGSLLEVGVPRNRFVFDPADDIVLVAGGIGITPILSMVAAARAAGSRWRLVYAGRSRSSMAFLPELLEHGDRVLVWESSLRGRLDLRDELAELRPGTVVYCCGPTALTDAVVEAVPDGVDVRSESFVPPVPGERHADVAFEVQIEGTDRRTEVPPGRSVLEALEELDVFVPSGCTVGVCGSCVTTVVEGEIEHRDAVLSEQDRADGDAMAVCVSRCRSARLVLRPAVL